MTIYAPDSESSDTRHLMLPRVAATMLRPWFKAHIVTVRRALAWFGVTEQEDRADLTQDVFFSAYLALVRGERIENPRAWLRECARKHASNYRHKERRRSPHIGGDPLVHGKDPEQIVAARERLHRAVAGLSAEAQSLIFDIRADGVSWAEVAHERGITIDQARYIYQRSVAQMEEVLNRDDLKEKARRLAAIPLDLALLGGASSEGGGAADDASPDTCRQQWKSLEQRMGADGEPVHEQEGPPSSSLAGSAASIAPHAARSLLGSLVGEGLAIGAVISYLLQLPSPARSPPLASPIEQTSTLATIAPPDSSSVIAPPLIPVSPVSPVSPTDPTDPTSQTTPAEPPTRREAPSALVKGRERSAKAVPRPREVYDAGSMALIDQARSTLTLGKLGEARDLSAQHTRQYLEKHHADARRDLLRMICAKPTERGAPECSIVRSATAPD
jgi:DNA-directed RNA polymerase specialized sigma24 family protein